MERMFIEGLLGSREVENGNGDLVSRSDFRLPILDELYY